MPDDRASFKAGKARSMPLPPIAKSKSQHAAGAASSAVQSHHHCRSLPPRAKPSAHDAAAQDHRSANSLPPHARPRLHDAARSPARSPSLGSPVEDAARTRKGLAPAAPSSHVAGPHRTLDRWKRHHAPPPPPTAGRWGHLETLLAVLFLTVFLVFLPLVLPQLPAPPVALLFVPLAVMAASLLVLAFLPSDFRTAASSYV